MSVGREAERISASGRIGPIDASKTPRFAGPASFARLPRLDEVPKADVVVAGYREHKTSTPERPLLGSLLLGLYADGELQHIGVSASFTEARRAELIEQLQPLVVPIEEHPWGRWAEFLTANPDRVPGTQSRWSQGKDLSFTPLRPDLVIEVAYDHMEGRRFRHTAQFRRWRTDRDPESCGYDQLEVTTPYELEKVFGARGHRP